jgi:hypothetical protein
MRMLWWFAALSASLVVVAAVSLTAYLRVRRQMKASDAALQGTLDEIEKERRTEKS